MVGLPRVSFETLHGSTLIFDGKRLRVDELSKMVCEMFHEATAILQDQILMGIPEETFGKPIEIDTIVDNLRNMDNGYGFLANKDVCLPLESIVKTFMEHRNTKDNFAYVDEDGIVQYNPEWYRKWLAAVGRFRELFYVIFHIVTSLPKRGTEEALFKTKNIIGRQRNVFWISKMMAIVGNYGKTTAITGADKATLQFLPPCLSLLLLRFSRVSASLERTIIATCYPNRTPNHDSYLWVNDRGVRMTSAMLSELLRRETKKHLGVAFSISDFRHFLPAIADHFCLLSTLNLSRGRAIGHQAMGHQGGDDNSIGFRTYSVTQESHPKISSYRILETIEQSKIIHQFYGYGSDVPSPQTEKQMAAWQRFENEEKVDQLDSVISQALELLSTLKQLTIIPGPVSNPRSNASHFKQSVQRVDSQSNDDKVLAPRAPLASGSNPSNASGSSGKARLPKIGSSTPRSSFNTKDKENEDPSQLSLEKNPPMPFISQNLGHSNKRKRQVNDQDDISVSAKPC